MSQPPRSRTSRSSRRVSPVPTIGDTLSRSNLTIDQLRDALFGTSDLSKGTEDTSYFAQEYDWMAIRLLLLAADGALTWHRIDRGRQFGVVRNYLIPDFYVDDEGRLVLSRYGLHCEWVFNSMLVVLPVLGVDSSLVGDLVASVDGRKSLSNLNDELISSLESSTSYGMDEDWFLNGQYVLGSYKWVCLGEVLYSPLVPRGLVEPRRIGNGYSTPCVTAYFDWSHLCIR